MKKLFSEIPYLKKGGLVLKRIGREDAPGLHDLTESSQVYRYLPTFLFEKTCDDTEEVIDRLYDECFKESIILGIFLENEFCGLAEMYDYQDKNHKISVGCRLREKMWGKGIASDVLDLMVSYLFEETDIEIITASTMVENRASAKVLIKNGFDLAASDVDEDWGYEQPTKADKWIRRQDRTAFCHEEKRKEDSMDKLNFASDYMKGAHSLIMERLAASNLIRTGGYGLDEFSESAREKIRKACGCPQARVEFLTGGTQTNMVVTAALLRSYQGVIAADTGHISTHEAGAIEGTGHKVLTLPQEKGKLSVDTVRDYMKDFYADANHDHMVMPGMIYLSQPTEYGTLYGREELEAFREICDEYDMALYVDGARLAYAMACPENDVTFADLARCCHAFYIGGTKCGALFGEAVVIPDPDRIPGFFTIIKKQGALFAKGRLLGLQFDTLFTDDFYSRIGIPAIKAADRIREALTGKGYQLFFDSPTNQVFCLMENERLEEFGRKVEYSFWEKYDDSHTLIRLATDWGTTDEEIRDLIRVL